MKSNPQRCITIEKIERAIGVLEGGPKAISFMRFGATGVKITFSFRGCDDDAFSIHADLASVKFWDEGDES